MQPQSLVGPDSHCLSCNRWPVSHKISRLPASATKQVVRSSTFPSLKPLLFTSRPIRSFLSACNRKPTAAVHSTAVAASTQPDIPDVRPDFRPNPQSPMSRLAQGVADLLRAHHASSTYPVSSTTNSAASLMVDMVFGFLTALRRLFGL